MITRLEYLATADVLLARELVRLRPHLQVLFFRLFLLTDGAGRFRADAAEIRAGLFAHELRMVSQRDVAGWVQELHRAGLVKLYTEGDVGYGKITGRFWQQRDAKRKVRHPDEEAPGPEPGLFATAPPAAVESPPSDSGGKSKVGRGGASPPFHSVSVPTARAGESDSAWLDRLRRAWPGVDLEVELREAAKKKPRGVERGWFEQHWLPKCSEKFVARSAGTMTPLPFEPAGWREVFPEYIHVAQPWTEIPADGRLHISLEMQKRREGAA